MTEVSLRTNKTIKELYDLGFTIPMIRAHYGETDNYRLNNHINTYVTFLRNSKSK